MIKTSNNRRLGIKRRGLMIRSIGNQKVWGGKMTETWRGGKDQQTMQKRMRKPNKLRKVRWTIYFTRKNPIGRYLVAQKVNSKKLQRSKLTKGKFSKWQKAILNLTLLPKKSLVQFQRNHSSLQTAHRMPKNLLLRSKDATKAKLQKIQWLNRVMMMLGLVLRTNRIDWAPEGRLKVTMIDSRGLMASCKRAEDSGRRQLATLQTS